MKQTAQVISLEGGGMATVRVLRRPACAGCDGGGGCCEGQEKPMETRVRNPIGAQPGEIVTVETPSGAILGTAAMVYLLPLIAFFVGYFAGGSILWGALAILPAFLATWLYNRRCTKTGRLTAAITSREALCSDT